MLSEVVARAYCPAAVPASPDRFFSVGCRIVGSHWLPADAADAARISSQAEAVSRTGRGPWEPDQEIDGVFNDLFSPFRDESDGRVAVWIPVPIEEPLSSTLMSGDWRVFAMVWWAARRLGLDPSRRVVVTAFDAAGRVVSTDMLAEDVYSAMELAVGMAPGAHESAGASCSSCSRAATCRGLEAFLSDYGRPSPPGSRENDDVRAQRLLSERSLVSLKLEHLERRKDIVEAELGKLVRDGYISVGGERLEVPARTTSSWDFAVVHRSLMARGLWDDSFGSVRASALQKAMEKFPEDLVKSLGKARTEKTSQPSIAEAVRHGRFATRAPVLGGVAIQGKGRLGAGK